MSNTAADNDNAPSYPIPISRLGHRYYLYDIAHITHLRITHHILGTLVGSLPQSPQQNLFLGLPLELTPEEARLLVAKGVCCIVKDVAAHRTGIAELSADERKSYRNLLQAQGREAAAQAVRRAEYKTESALGRLDEKRREKALKALKKSKESGEPTQEDASADAKLLDNEEPGSLFSAPAAAAGSSISSPTPLQLQAHGITPTTSHPPLPLFPGSKIFFMPSKPSALASTPAPAPAPTPSPPLHSMPTFNAAALPSFLPSPAPTPSPPLDYTPSFNAAALPSFLPSPPPTPPSAPIESNPSTSTPEPIVSLTPPPPPTSILPPAPHSYPLFAHLHSLSYYMSPGLRFGCQYCVYPGDPLRFHSHFLAVGADWDEEMDLLTLVGGGRLGTGVKKGFLLGGVERKAGGVAVTAMDGEGEKEREQDGEGVRCFCIEWGGM